jgi:hypothetical protein
MSQLLTAASDLQLTFKLKSELSYDRWSVGQSVLVSGHHLGPAPNFSFTSMEDSFRHLQFSSCGVPFQMRGWFCNLSVQLLLGLASTVILRFKFHRTRDHILLSHLRLSFYLSSLTTRRATVEIFTTYSLVADHTENATVGSSSVIALGMWFLCHYPSVAASCSIFHGVHCYIVFEPVISAGNLRSEVVLYAYKYSIFLCI